MSTTHVAILKNARNLIENKRYSFICCALESRELQDDCYHLPNFYQSKNEINWKIKALLDGAYTLETWIKDYIETSSESFPAFDAFDAYDEHKSKKMVSTRLAWIDEMIVYWKDKP